MIFCYVQNHQVISLVVTLWQVVTKLKYGNCKKAASVSVPFLTYLV
jgi:hypothetical protein